MTFFVLLLSLAAQQDEQREADMFGAPEEKTEGADGGAPVAQVDDGRLPSAFDLTQADGGISQDDSVLGAALGHSRFDSDEEKTDPLKIGGTLYLRAQGYWYEKQRFQDITFSSPELLDVYLDARPNERVRGVVVGRLLYEPTRASGSTASGFSGGGLSTVSAPQSNPAVFLDQMYLRFDIARTIFVTAGRQKIKWGTAHIWNPTDAINSQRRDPFQPFDLRLGVNALKLHLPIESLGWNFYAYGLLDNSEPASTLGKLGGGARAEFVIPKVRAEIGLDAVWVQGRRPRYGIDFSVPLPDPIPIDLFGEFSFRSGADFVIWDVEGDFDVSNPFSARVTGRRGQGIISQFAVGAQGAFPLGPTQIAQAGVEYFYNPVGLTKPLYPVLALQPQLCAAGFNVQCDLTAEYTPFYAAQHYAGVFVLLPSLPEFNWIGVNFTGLMNISDLSALVRVDAFFRVLQFLQIEAFAAVNMGTRGGELRFAFDTPAFTLPDGSTTELHVPAPIASFGLGLRVNI